MPARDALVICGDHNNLLTGSLRALLLQGKVDAGYTEHGKVVTDTTFSHAFHLLSAYDEPSPEPTFIMPPASHYRLDHICYTPATLAVLGTLKVLPEGDREEILTRALPSMKYPSDHMPVGAVFRLHATLAVPTS